MSLWDVETSAEAIQEDEELIEAVEQIVEKAAEAIYADLKNDVSGFYFRVRYFVENMFPFIIDWREDGSLFWSDMQKVALFGLLYAITFWMLSPSSRWARNSANGWPSYRNSKFLERRTSSIDRFNIALRNFSPFCRGPDPSCNRPPLERSRSTSSINYSIHRIHERGEEEHAETEEEKFAKRWPAILETRYRILVLPPECKRVEKRRRKHVPKVVDNKQEKNTKPDQVARDEENPYQRLVYYWRQFLHLMVSFLRYDYVGAGWTLIHWFEACLRSRRNRSTSATLPHEEEEDDESDAGSVRRLSMSSQSSLTTNISSSSSGPLRGKQDSLITHKRGKLHRFLDNIPKKKEIADVGESNDTVDQPHLSLTLDTSILEEGEEKKDSSYDAEQLATPPQTPISKTNLPRVGSVNSLYETPKLELREDLGDGLATKIALHPKFPTNGQKAKDALENYRNVASRKGSLFCPDSPPQVRRRGVAGDGHFSAPSVPPNLERNESTATSYYFETVSTKESLMKMSVEVPVPDRYGYIVGDEFLPDNTWTPLLVFVNSRSGPQQGHLLIAQLRGLLNPMQVWDLADGGPEEILESFSTLTRLRILVCGGDGTVSWIVSAIEKMKLQRWPPIAILPLGTGNDLARIHGWGGGYNNESLVGILEQVAGSYISWLDRWEMTVENKKGNVKRTKSFFNYLGVGADAQAALQVHLLRESRPQLFFSRIVNKAWYGVFGAEDIVKATSVNLRHEITLIADGVEVPLPHDSQGIILLNIDSYAGGVPLWSSGTKGESRGNSPMGSRVNSLQEVPLKRSRSLDALKGIKESFNPIDRVDSIEDIAELLSEEERFLRVTACDRPSSCQDGLLDIVSIRGAFHLGQIRVGLSNAQKLCQCREATIIIKRKVSVQTDGEPWRQNICTLHVKRKKDAAIMLHRAADDSNGVETEMAKLLDWAEERKLIDSKVHAALMKEFSRRIESKTRQRRVKQDNIMSSLKRAMGSTGNLGLQ